MARAKALGPLAFSEKFRPPNRSRSARGEHGARTGSRGGAHRVRVRDRAGRRARACADMTTRPCHCATRMSSPCTCNVHANPTSDNGSRAPKLLVTMLTTSPRCVPDVIAHSSATPSSRASAQMMNASYAPSSSCVMRTTRRRHASSSEKPRTRMRVSDDDAMHRATSGGCQPRSVTNA